MLNMQSGQNAWRIYVMDAADRVEAIARRIDKDFNVEYLGRDQLNAFGARYIDASDFIFAGPNNKQFRVHVSGRDCAECGDDAELEKLLRSRIEEALRKVQGSADEFPSR
jgi:hypothetical protein